MPGSDLAGPQGSHPLAGIRLEDLLRPATDGLSGGIELDRPIRVGEGIRGLVRVTANREIRARAAAFRIEALRAGADLSLRLPEDLPPTLDAAGLKVRYVVRAVVDIAFRPDASVERLVVVT